MAKPVAYVIGSALNAETEARIEAGLLPRFEYHEFLLRNNADLLTLGHIDYSRSPIAGMWRRAQQPLPALASVTIERARSYSAVLCSGEDIGLPLALGSVFSRARVPIFIITHGSYLGSPKFNAVASILRRMGWVRFLTLSETLRTDLVSRFRIPQDRVINASYGIDTKFFTPRPAPVGAQPLVVSAGTANRDYKTLVTALKPMRVPVKIAADSTWFPSAVDIEGAKLPDTVEVRSFGDYVGLRDLYAAASIVAVPLYPAVHACGYAVIAEAMAMGKPVITTRIASHSDFVADHATGYYVGACDPDEMRTRIATLLAHPQLGERMGMAARERMEEHYSLGAYCTRIEKAMGLK